ncbi:DUF4255 domain-containing protein [Streptomyces sp. NPDC052036]|uniref:DUF4255 domain-containing protein n=1 Tax=Streptomyces sp. NPDC052036 TaxID=3155171 RepID=UPI003420A69B
MIHEIDEALRRLLRAKALPEGAAQVVFDAPTRDWAARRNSPTVDAYLYDVREEVARRERGAMALSHASGMVTRRRQPPRWFRLSCLLTAWTKRSEDEHRLPSAVLTGLLPHEALPAECLDGALADLGLAIPLTVGVPPVESRSIADIWSALGGELKPSLEVGVVAPMPASATSGAGAPPSRSLIKDKVAVGGPVTDPELQTRFIDPLVLACTEHNGVNARLGLDAVGLDPRRTAWLGDGARRDQHRNPVIEPLLRHAMSLPRVRPRGTGRLRFLVPGETRCGSPAGTRLSTRKSI